MALIERDALLKELCEDTEESTFELTKTQIEACEKVVRYMYSVIVRQPSVPAVPLDKLCEWLAEYTEPCKLGIRCEYAVDFTCMSGKDCWRYVLKKWMEEQDAADRH